MLDETVRRAAEGLEAASEEEAGFLAALGSARAFCERQPARGSFVTRADVTARALGPDGRLPPEEAAALLRDVHGWLGILAHGLVHRTHALLDDVESGLNERRFFRALGAARALVEHGAVLNYRHAELAADVALLARAAPEGARVAALVRAHATLVALVGQTRFGWEAGVARGDLATFYSLAPPKKSAKGAEAVSVLTLIGKLPGVEPQAAKWYYGMLCDFVHPNGPSLLLHEEEVRPLPDGRVSHTVAFRPQSPEALERVLHLLAIPVKYALLGLVDQAGELLERHRALEERLQPPSEPSAAAVPGSAASVRASIGDV